MSLHIRDFYGSPGDSLAFETIPFQMYVLLLHVSDQLVNTEKLPSQVRRGAHQNNTIRKILLSLICAAECSWIILIKFLAAGMSISHHCLVHMETGRFCLDMILQTVDFVVAVYVDS
jgi:hypothetical protein